VSAGAELLTIWANVSNGGDSSGGEIPLLSVLRDTLGDTNKTNDLFRQLWVYTYARPSLRQRAGALVPFLYRQVSNKRRVQVSELPPAIIDLSNTEQETWKSLFVSVATLGFRSQSLAPP
jgi:hypothetical protein